MTIKIERISSPLASGTVIPMSSRDEMLLSPASLILPANASDVIRFTTRGRMMPRSVTTASFGSIRR